jgi:hypothetical protein
MTATPRRSALVAMALVLLMHGAGWWLLRSLPNARHRDATASSQAPLMLRLLWPEPEKPTAARAAAPTTSTPVRRPTVVLPQHTVTPSPQAISVQPAEPPASAVAADTAPHPLVLTLPPQAASAPPSARERALNDPRSNTATKGFSERFAATLGTDQTERITPLNGGHRMRRGSSCYDVMDSRASQIDPYGPKWPGGVSSCN